MPDNKAQKIVKKFDELYTDASNMRDKAAEISEWIVPERGRYLTCQPITEDTTKKGTKKHNRIINGTAGKSVSSLSANMQAGMTSPAQKWASVTVEDPVIADIPAVKTWTYDVQNIILSVLAKSNFYNITPGIYTELATFGTAGYLIERDPETFIRFRPFTFGEFYFSLDARYRPNALYRKFTMSASQMEEKFERSKLSQAVKTAIDTNEGETRFEVIHAIEPNDNSVSGVRRAFEYQSLYLEEESASDNKFLSVGGYFTKPFVIVRWETVGTDPFGISPAMDALGDVKQLQSMEQDAAQALQKQTNPPMIATSDMKNKPASLLPGAITYVNPMHGSSGFAPAINVQLDVNGTEIKIQNTERRIDRFFFGDIINAFLRSTNRKTATEIEEQSKEKLLTLGPVIESVEDEMLDDTIIGTFNKLDEMGFIPPPPPEMEGMPLKIEYEGFLSSAQKAVSLTANDQLFSATAAVAGLVPEVRFKFDAFADFNDRAQKLGVNPKTVRSDDDAKALMEAEQKAIQQQQATQQMGDTASTAKILGDTPLGDSNALDAIVQGAI